MKNIVTLIDACTFGTDWMSWNSAQEREGFMEEDDENCSSQKNVPELLAEQVEAADILLVNKIDLAGKEQVEVASAVAKGLNEKASVFEVSFGKVASSELFGMIGTEIDVQEHATEEKSHDHSHSHDHSSDVTSEINIDQSHDHSHDHISSDCTDPGCADPSHDHSHSHSHDHAADCADPECTDPTHDHSHLHSHNHSSESHLDDLGIINFVYKADRPFSSTRLLNVLNFWPVPIKDTLDIAVFKEAAEEGIQRGDIVDKNPFVGVLRSKGFVWLAPVSWTGLSADTWRHDTAMYWSHAGKHFGINTAGSKSMKD